MGGCHAIARCEMAHPQTDRSHHARQFVSQADSAGILPHGKLRQVRAAEATGTHLDKYLTRADRRRVNFAQTEATSWPCQDGPHRPHKLFPAPRISGCCRRPETLLEDHWRDGDTLPAHIVQDVYLVIE